MITLLGVNILWKNLNDPAFYVLLFVILSGWLIILVQLAVRRNRERTEFPGKPVRHWEYYKDEYLKSDDWKRKRYVVLKRDNWKCVYCGAPATQVHHKRYAKYNIGKEPIDWLVSVCYSCHRKIHDTRR